MPKKILVVDDDAILVRALAMVLRHNGYDVVAAQNGLQAVASAATESPDLVLLDLTMPGMDGWEVCRTIRGSCRAAVILLSGHQLSDQEITAKLGGMTINNYLIKPVRNETLLAAVKAALP